MTEINPIEWEHRVRDDQSLSRETYLALLTLKTRYPNIRPGLEQFARDCRVSMNTAIKYIKLARESGYVNRTHEGTHAGDVDEYELSYPTGMENRTSTKNCDQSSSQLVPKTVTRPVPKIVTSSGTKNCDPKTSTKEIKEDYKQPSSPSGSPGSQVLIKQPHRLALYKVPTGVDVPRESPVPVKRVPKPKTTKAQQEAAWAEDIVRRERNPR